MYPPVNPCSLSKSRIKAREINAVQLGARPLKSQVFVCLFVWVDALRPLSTAEVMLGQSLVLSTLFWGNPPRGR